eukprot:TRINITY_DN22018_c0_g1_i1.p1 TRINITY_DN22018_c0_g1~~TRINITY_DN22018_c0_g1_i1.p1  ORF type:complete len:817 (-),score=129.69 TRINITY_DN22018_c0_g1_i1:325-2715(-)
MSLDIDDRGLPKRGDRHGSGDRWLSPGSGNELSSVSTEAETPEHALVKKLQAVQTVVSKTQARIAKMLSDCQASTSQVLVEAARNRSETQRLRGKLIAAGVPLDASELDKCTGGTGDSCSESSRHDLSIDVFHPPLPLPVPKAMASAPQLTGVDVTGSMSIRSGTEASLPQSSPKPARLPTLTKKNGMHTLPVPPIITKRHMEGQLAPSPSQSHLVIGGSRSVRVPKPPVTGAPPPLPLPPVDLCVLSTLEISSSKCTSIPGAVNNSWSGSDADTEKGGHVTSGGDTSPTEGSPSKTAVKRTVAKAPVRRLSPMPRRPHGSRSPTSFNVGSLGFGISSEDKLSSDGVQATGGGKSAKKGPPRGVFCDLEATKDRLRDMLSDKAYNVHDLYADTGYCQVVARSHWFENFTLIIIGFNALWIAIDTDYNEASMLSQAHWTFQVAEHFFCVYYTGEILIRLFAFKRARDSLTDAWFCFDACLVIFMVMETWVLEIVYTILGVGKQNVFSNGSFFRMIRLLRLSRMARLARLIRSFPELMVLITGVGVALRSVFFTLCLLILIIYVFAIMFAQLTASTDVGDKYFSSVWSAMSTLLLGGTMPDHQDIVHNVSSGGGTDGVLVGGLFLIFMLLGSLTVMNMLIGVLVEVVGVVAAVEKETMIVNYFRAQLKSTLQENFRDMDDDDCITKDEFSKLLNVPEAAFALRDLGVDVVGLVDLVDFIFASYGNTLTFNEFMETILQLRGSTTATVKDMVDLRRFMQAQIHRLEGRVLESIGRVTSERLQTSSTGQEAAWTVEQAIH